MRMTIVSVRRSFVKWLAAIIVVGLFGCVSRHVEIEQIGVMQVRKYWKTGSVPWWGSKKSLEKEEICPPSGLNCITAKHLSHNAGNGLLWVAVNENVPPETAPAIHFFNTKTGMQVPCPACAEFIKAWQVGSSSGWWFESDRHIAFVFKRLGTDRGLLIAHVDAVANVVTLSIVKDDTGINLISYGFSISPKEDNLAWFECEVVCTLHSLNDDYSKILSTPTVCGSKDLEVYWENGRPMTGFRAGTSKFETCRDDKGALKYPLQPWTF